MDKGLSQLRSVYMSATTTTYSLLSALFLFLNTAVYAGLASA